MAWYGLAGKDSHWGRYRDGWGPETGRWDAGMGGLIVHFSIW